MKRGEVWMVELKPRSGSEQQGTRPAIVVSSDVYNGVPGWRSFNVIPITSSGRPARRSHTTVPLEAGAAGLTQDSVAICHQVTTLDRTKFVRKLGALAPGQMQEVELGVVKALDMLHLLP